jgi:hypothetical protein
MMIWLGREMRRVKYDVESLEVLSHPDYNVTTLIDQTAMAMLKSQSFKSSLQSVASF